MICMNVHNSDVHAARVYISAEVANHARKSRRHKNVTHLTINAIVDQNITSLVMYWADGSDLISAVRVAQPLFRFSASYCDSFSPGAHDGLCTFDGEHFVTAPVGGPVDEELFTASAHAGGRVVR